MMAAEDDLLRKRTQEVVNASHYIFAQVGGRHPEREGSVPRMIRRRLQAREARLDPCEALFGGPEIHRERDQIVYLGDGSGV